MKRTTALVLGPLLTLMLLNAGAASEKRGARTAIERAAKTFAEGVKAGDAATMASLYAEDAKAFPPNGEMVTGRAAIQQMWQDALASGIKEMEIKPAEIEESGDHAYEVGAYVINGEGGKHLDHGKYVVVWKRKNGEWKMYRDIWNSDMPAAPAAQ